MDPQTKATGERIKRRCREIIRAMNQILTDAASYNDNHDFKLGERPLSPDDLALVLTTKQAAHRIIWAIENEQPVEDRDLDALFRAMRED